MDERRILAARKHYKQSNLTCEVMDAVALNFPDNRFDAVFDFGIIHHIPNWRNCIEELSRILKPTGRLILEEFSIDSFSTGVGRLWQIMFCHPYKSMYTTEEFTDFVSISGFEILNYKELNPLKMLRYFSLIAKKK